MKMFGFGGSKTQAGSSPESTTPAGQSTLSEMGGSNQLRKLKADARQQLSLAHAQELVQTMTKHCFDACVPVPTESLSGSQQKCVTQCMGLYTQVSDPGASVAIYNADHYRLGASFNNHTLTECNRSRQMVTCDVMEFHGYKYEQSLHTLWHGWQRSTVTKYDQDFCNWGARWLTVSTLVLAKPFDGCCFRKIGPRSSN